MTIARSRWLALAALTALGAAGCGDRDADRDRPAQRAPRQQAPRTAPAPGATAPPGAVAWTHAALVRRLAGTRIAAGGRRVRVDPATLTCGGVGAPRRRISGVPAWTRFRCVQPTFPPGAVAGPDVLFVVEPRGARRLVVTDARLSAY